MAYKIEYKGLTKRDSWECFSWLVTINGQTFQYFTGLGHATKALGLYNERKPKDLIKKVIKESNLYVHVPKLRDVLHSIASDASLAQDSFDDFCSNLGYDTDSRKALETYLACQDNGVKLRKALKSHDAVNRINQWEL